jgi:MamI restriction endonuclease
MRDYHSITKIPPSVLRMTQSYKLGTVEASEQLIRDVYIDLRRQLKKWATITHQTAQARMGYIGQHLVSTATGFRGGKSGARGRDIIISEKQFGEIKTCYRVDQLGKCLDCDAVVASIEDFCQACESVNLQRNDDSKWLIGIRNDAEFEELLDPCIYYLVLFDFIDLQAKEKTIRASIWQVDPTTSGFLYCMIDYYLNIRAKSKSKAPFNLWPYDFKFQLMKPQLIYRSFILPNDSVKTELFPGRDKPTRTELKLAEYLRSTAMTTAALENVVKKFKISVPTATRPGLIAGIDNAVLTGKLQIDAVIDSLTEGVYLPRVGEHIDGLPAKLKRHFVRAQGS